jgi:hypothetical protein
VILDVDRVMPKRVTFTYERVCELDSRVSIYERRVVYK